LHQLQEQNNSNTRRGSQCSSLAPKQIKKNPQDLGPKRALEPCQNRQRNKRGDQTPIYLISPCHSFKENGVKHSEVEFNPLVTNHSTVDDDDQ
jgi:hypothetical protein